MPEQDSTREELLQEVNRLRFELAKHRDAQTEGTDFSYPGAWEQWVDAMGRVIYVSPSCESVTGHPTESFFRDSRFLEKITFPEDRHLVVDSETDGYQEEDYARDVVVRIISRDGNMKWVRHVCRPAFGHGGSYQGRRSYNNDISAQVHAEEALRESEERRKAIVSAMPDLLFRFDREGVCLDFSTPSEDLLPVPPESLTGAKVADLGLPEKFIQGFSEVLKKVFTQGTTVTTDFTMDVPIGMREFEARVVPCGDDEVIAIARDVTQQRRTERALRASEARYHAIVEDQTEIILRFETDGTLSFVNSAFARAMDREPEALMGWKVWDYVPRELYNSVAERLELFTPGNPVVVSESEMRFPGLPGPRWIEWTSRAIFDEDRHVTELQCVGRDVTQRKRAEDALSISEARFRHIYEYVPVMMYSIDREGNICDVNRKWLSELGYRRSDVIGQPAIKFMTEESGKRAMSEVIPRFWREGHVSDVAYQYIRADGEVIDVLLNCVATRDPNGKEVSLSVVRNVTGQDRG